MLIQKLQKFIKIILNSELAQNTKSAERQKTSFLELNSFLLT